MRFTLVECLVGVVIVLMLMGLLMPAITAISGVRYAEKREISTPMESGVLTKVEMCHEGGCYTTFLVYFEDGRIVKCRVYYNQVVKFWTGKTNALTFEGDGCTLKQVDTPFLEKPAGKTGM